MRSNRMSGGGGLLLNMIRQLRADDEADDDDEPYDNQLGERVTRETIDGVEAMPIDAASKKKIYADNARRLFRLPV